MSGCKVGRNDLFVMVWIGCISIAFFIDIPLDALEYPDREEHYERNMGLNMLNYVGKHT